ncbi:1D-myo-inositol 2-acetamido-2-deoxy-alpha-D-glucopyranoside deacetylase [Caulifigura coniformis]|uniref:1D-myo-inositol 2-acetamido-2-deoxy-alpha-D-glucopyranoside deacetylase n=1 Tax=Caulifigura coniformis TaxID=2527983 RepID=A0A517SJB5_9PLAN|nr:bacillithiol biosynthesis deacetylase BshB1 [Caulifigura coniformis]QDT56205.1 1D-myo-inositol 2-acetamido-2-deoxy-alpha-D-glucopyranoside deacetylase [Caulifigura coniformis]
MPEVAPSQLDILVVAAHPDDAEISVGGTIATSLRAGLSVGILDLTTGEPTPFGTLEKRLAETEAASRALGVTWRQNLNLPNRKLQNDLESRAKIAEVFRLTRPKVILGHYPEDVHPDHVAASQLVDAARFWSKLSRTDLAGEPWWPPRLYHYWSIHLRIHPKPSFVLDISSAIDAKMEAIACYRSQFTEGREPVFPSPLDDIRDRARYWGWSIHKAFGEPFASREDIGISAFDSLL